jgi:ribosome recycling factor
VSLVQVHPDAASADHHLEVAGSRILAAADLFENVGVDVYGSPGPLLQLAIAHNANSGVPVRVFDAVLGGFARK